MKSKIRNIGFGLFMLLVPAVMNAQRVSGIYKADQLVNRINAGSDTLYVVNFWATWCKPCVAELPAFQNLHDSLGKTKLKVLLVSMDFKEDMKAKLIPFLKKNKYTARLSCLMRSMVMISSIRSIQNGVGPFPQH